MKPYTPTQAAEHLGMSPDYLRMKLKQGELENIGKAFRPSRGHKHWRYICYPARVAEMTGIAILWDGKKYLPR